MKKFYLVSTLIFAIAVVGCSKQENNNGAVDVENTTLSVGLPSEISRTAVDDAGSARWVAGDTFALWAENRTGMMKAEAVEFLMYYYWHSYQYAVFTAKSFPTLEEGEYTYYATAPTPNSTANWVANYTIPTEQAADAFNGKLDIMVATPLVAEAITPDNTVNTLDMDFAHKTHLLKVNIAENELGTPISTLRFTFPTGVTGTMSLDVKDATAAPTLSDASTALNLNLSNAIDVGNGTAWGTIFPANVEGDVKVTAVGTDGRLSKEKTINIAKNYEEGHITPLSFSVPVIRPTLRFSIGTNYLGEPIEKLKITDHQGGSAEWDVNEHNRYDYSIDGDFTESVFDHYEGQTFTATFESKNAIVSTTFVMPSDLTWGLNVIPAIDVPYLLFEDFSCIHTAGESYGDNGQASDERKQPGVSLDSYMSHTGWNAARFLLGVGTCPRINVRSQMVKIVMSFASKHHGRLDTPPLTGLKAGAKVNLCVQFDAGGYEYEGASGEIMSISLASHTNLSNPIDGIPTGTESFSLSPFGPVEYSTTLSDFGTTHYVASMSSLYGNNSFGSTFPTHTATVSAATNSTRLVFYPTTSVEMSSIDNSESAIYIDNIKVSIIYEPEEE